MTSSLRVSTLIRPNFDYSVVKTDVASGLQRSADKIRSLQKAAAIDIGNELLSAKASLDHGQFRKWLEAETDLSPATATRLMQVAENIGPDKWFTVKHLPAGVLYELASPSTPEDVRAAIMKVEPDRMADPKQVLHFIRQNKIHQAKAEKRAAKRDPEKVAAAAQAAEKQEAKQAASEEKFAKGQVPTYLKAMEAVEIITEALGADLSHFAELYSASPWIFSEVFSSTINPDRPCSRPLQLAREARERDASRSKKLKAA